MGFIDDLGGNRGDRGVRGVKSGYLFSMLPP